MKLLLKKTLTLSLIAVLTSACNEAGTSASGSQGSSNIVNPLKGSTPILKYSGGTITAADVGDLVSPKIKSLNAQIIKDYQKAAENKVIEKLLDAEAKKQGVPDARALMEKVAATATVTDAKVDAFFKKNNLSKGYKDPQTGKTKDVSKEEVKKFLLEQEKNTARQALVQSVQTKANVQVLLEEPRINITLPHADQVLGPKTAKVVVHEFSDFQCPFCSRAKDVVSQIHKEYGDKVAIAFHHFPLSFHKEAKPSAIASNCAGKQGKFWAYHDLLFDKQRELKGENYPKWAESMSLNMDEFNKCMKDAAIASRVDDDFKKAQGYGVNSTPTFFVNGKKLAGALPFPEFKKIIDAELNK